MTSSLRETLTPSFLTRRPVLTTVLLILVVFASFAFGVTLREMGFGTQVRAQTSPPSNSSGPTNTWGDAKPLWSFGDEFNYTDMSQMLAAGWTLNNVPSSY